jgi:peptide chain release factor 3
MDRMSQDISQQIARRRTFAIISHPDAGKTTLTEKLLLYSGMVRTAGMVRGRKGSKATSSDWMGMEQERGISISASAMQFPYKDAIINVLDTPGHQDFSEDTYRTLTAADSAIMVIDGGKGVEAQTRKLFAVCRMQRIPILTFINKMDLPSKDVLALLQEVEEVLGIRAVPRNWPIGYGKNFCGIIDVPTQTVFRYQKTAPGGALKAEVKEFRLEEARKDDSFDAYALTQLDEELELLEIAGTPFSKQEFLDGQQTPVYFGSALNNYGVETFFDHFVDLAPSPRPRRAQVEGEGTVVVDPAKENFTGFVFKVQANMNPRHRDSMAFIRICSGKFSRDMNVYHHRLQKEVRLSRSYAMVAKERDTVDEAYAGDIVGVINPGVFSIGDTVSCGSAFNYPPLPAFPPEVVARVRPKDVMKKKAFDKGVLQLSSEGAIQLLREHARPEAPPLVAAVGQLQFEVLQYRLLDEYRVEVIIEQMPYRHSLYLEGDPKTLERTQGSTLVVDREDRVVVLYTSEWERGFMLDRNPHHTFREYFA